MNNSLQDLNNILFEQIERINDDSLTETELQSAIKKADGINRLATTIVNNANLQLRAYQEMGRKAEKGIQKTLGIEE